MTVAVVNGIGTDFWLLESHSAERALFPATIALTFLVLGYGPGKFAVIAFLLRVQGPTHVKKSWFLYFLAISNVSTFSCLVTVASLRILSSRSNAT